MSIVINHNACVRTRVFEQCIFDLVRGLCECPCSRWVPRSSRPPLHLILPHFSSLVSKTLATCTSSTLQKPRRQEEGSPLLLNISSFPFLSFGERQHTPALLSTVHRIYSEHLKHTLFCTAHTRWIQHISVAAGPLTHDLLSRYLHNPHGSTLQPPGGNASCGEHLFNLSSRWNGV